MTAHIDYIRGRTNKWPIVYAETHHTMEGYDAAIQEVAQLALEIHEDEHDEVFFSVVYLPVENVAEFKREPFGYGPRAGILGLLVTRKPDDPTVALAMPTGWQRLGWLTSGNRRVRDLHRVELASLLHNELSGVPVLAP